MTLADILQDIHAMEEDLLMYERKYGILSETFYESYTQGDEPPEHVSTLEWNDWAGAYQIWLRRHQQYKETIHALQKETPLIQLIAKAIRRESLPVPT